MRRRKRKKYVIVPRMNGTWWFVWKGKIGKGGIYVPADVRRRLELKPGDEVVIGIVARETGWLKEAAKKYWEAVKELEVKRIPHEPTPEMCQKCPKRDICPHSKAKKRKEYVV